jgi:hypothetical protein
MSILRSSIKKDIDLRLSAHLYKTKTFEKTKLSIDEYTTFDIYYDVFNLNSKKYLYIKMVENTAFAPFIYNRSYELEELHENNNIFKSCTTLEKVKEHLTALFKNNKIKLKYEDNKEIIKMEMDVVLFCKPLVVTFDLYIEMSPPEMKDEHLLSLYDMNKMDLKNLKELLNYIQTNFKNEEAKQLIEIFRQSDIPGIEI